MAILNIFSPGWVNGDTATQFVPNPWGTPDAPAGDVWVQCTVAALQVNDTISLGGFGIIEIAFLDGNGHPQTTTFGDTNDLSNVAVFEYTGKTAMTAVGPVTGLRYRFAGPGSRLAVDLRDRSRLAEIPNLAQVRSV